MEESVWMAPVTALLDSLGLCVKSTLMTALESTVATGEGAWMEFKITPAAAILDILEQCVK